MVHTSALGLGEICQQQLVFVVGVATQQRLIECVSACDIRIADGTVGVEVVLGSAAGRSDAQHTAFRGGGCAPHPEQTMCTVQRHTGNCGAHHLTTSELLAAYARRLAFVAHVSLP
jgi:hypothetical protein